MRCSSRAEIDMIRTARRPRSDSRTTVTSASIGAVPSSRSIATQAKSPKVRCERPDRSRPLPETLSEKTSWAGPSGPPSRTTTGTFAPTRTKSRRCDGRRLLGVGDGRDAHRPAAVVVGDRHVDRDDAAAGRDLDRGGLADRAAAAAAA